MWRRWRAGRMSSNERESREFTQERQAEPNFAFFFSFFSFFAFEPPPHDGGRSAKMRWATLRWAMRRWRESEKVKVKVKEKERKKCEKREANDCVRLSAFFLFGRHKPRPKPGWLRCAVLSHLSWERHLPAITQHAPILDGHDHLGPHRQENVRTTPSFCNVSDGHLMQNAIRGRWAAQSG